MKKGKIIEMSQETLIICDNPSCTYTVPNTTGNADSNDIKEYLNKPCPKCNSNLLTEKDYKAFKSLIKFVNIINFLFGWITYLIPLKEKTTVSIHHHEGKTTIEEVK